MAQKLISLVRVLKDDCYRCDNSVSGKEGCFDTSKRAKILAPTQSAIKDVLMGMIDKKDWELRQEIILYNNIVYDAQHLMVYEVREVVKKLERRLFFWLDKPNYLYAEITAFHYIIWLDYLRALDETA